MTTTGQQREFTAITWNVAGRLKPAMIELLQSLRPDVAFLQEVKAEHWPALKRALDADGLMGLEVRPRLEGEGGARALGAALAVRRPLTLQAGSVIEQEGFAWPERGVTGVAALDADHPPLRLVSYHALHGGHRQRKPETSFALAKWLVDQEGPVILGMDANSPDVDHPDESLIKAHWNQTATRALERALVGPAGERPHRLQDVWRTHLRDRPDLASAIATENPLGPLAVTHRTGRHPKQSRRYDHIWATPDLDVLEVRHLEEGFTAGSDHAVVWVRLAMRTRAGS